MSEVNITHSKINQRGRLRSRFENPTEEQESSGSGLEIDVGQRLRALRSERGLSIRALAELSGLNVNTLSLIENGKTSPSVSTLQQLAHGLEVPITAFFETQDSGKRIVYQRAGQRPRAAFACGMLEDLGAGIALRELEPLIVTLEPGSDSGETPIVHTGLELVYCLEGQINYQIENETFELVPGDSLLFEARLPHGWQNPSAEPARALLALCASDEMDEPLDLHFSLE
jgi:transcriptional regulator with XRE-family HTH domain